MPPKDVQSLPFVTRDMLAFQHGLSFTLKLEARSSTSTPVTIRGMTREGVFTFSHVLNGTTIREEVTFSLPDIPIMLSVTDSAFGLTQGRAYITMSLMVNGDKLYELCSGYVYAQKSISWPQNNTEEARLGAGRMRQTSGSDPAAGAEATIIVPNASIWAVHEINVTLVTSATVAARRVHFVLNHATFETHAFSDVDQAASTTRIYSGAKYGNLPDREDSTEILIPIPETIWLTSGESIDTQTTNLQVGDDLGPIFVRVEEFIVP